MSVFLGLQQHFPFAGALLCSGVQCAYCLMLLLLLRLQEADASLDAHIHQMTSCIKAMTEAAANKPHFYVTDDDITNLPCFK
jgi:hypothetical protein